MNENAGEITYTDAMAELEAILDEIESDQLDVDLLASRVKRASDLIKVCRERIVRAKADVDSIVTDLEAFESELDAGGDD